jgi:DNA-directed RNA polymerase specialized sigma24 family protein
MKKIKDMPLENFDILLSWLNEDEETAEKRYEAIRRSLIFYFSKRGGRYPEDLADETISRVAAKAPSLINSYKGVPELYFFGVARIVLKEYQRTSFKDSSLDEAMAFGREPKSQSSDPIRLEYMLSCLENCVQQLDDQERELFLQYFSGTNDQDGKFRIKLAAHLGINYPALRVRIHRIRLILKDCIQSCVSKLEEKMIH